MLISSEANAAEALAPDEDARFYDDIGCLVADRHATKPNTFRYVRLADGSGWMGVDAARFAVSPATATPMGHGILAFAAEGAARAADVNGDARTWDDVLQRAEAR
jgi:copper chaperone NosL